LSTTDHESTLLLVIERFIAVGRDESWSGLTSEAAQADLAKETNKITLKTAYARLTGSTVDEGLMVN
jgi:hypothetical protein